MGSDLILARYILFKRTQEFRRLKVCYLVKFLLLNLLSLIMTRVKHVQQVLTVMIGLDLVLAMMRSLSVYGQKI